MENTVIDIAYTLALKTNDDLLTMIDREQKKCEKILVWLTVIAGYVAVEMFKSKPQPTHPAEFSSTAIFFIYAAGAAYGLSMASCIISFFSRKIRTLPAKFFYNLDSESMDEKGFKIIAFKEIKEIIAANEFVVVWIRVCTSVALFSLLASMVFIATSYKYL